MQVVQCETEKKKNIQNAAPVMTPRKRASTLGVISELPNTQNTNKQVDSGSPTLAGGKILQQRAQRLNSISSSNSSLNGDSLPVVAGNQLTFSNQFLYFGNYLPNQTGVTGLKDYRHKIIFFKRSVNRDKETKMWQKLAKIVQYDKKRSRKVMSHILHLTLYLSNEAKDANKRHCKNGQKSTKIFSSSSKANSMQFTLYPRDRNFQTKILLTFHVTLT